MLLAAQVDEMEEVVHLLGDPSGSGVGVLDNIIRSSFAVDVGMKESRGGRRVEGGEGRGGQKGRGEGEQVWGAR